MLILVNLPKTIFEKTHFLSKISFFSLSSKDELLWHNRLRDWQQKWYQLYNIHYCFNRNHDAFARRQLLCVRLLV